MNKLHFEILIHASPNKVWDAVTDEKKYREWTSPFNPTSYFEGGWEKGDKIRFIGQDENGAIGGMLAEIAESRKYEFISIRHLGYIQNGVEDTSSETVRAWAPAYENYTFKETGEGTMFGVDIDVEETYTEMFGEMWPKALNLLKQIAEK